MSVFTIFTMSMFTKKELEPMPRSARRKVEKMLKTLRLQARKIRHLESILNAKQDEKNYQKFEFLAHAENQEKITQEKITQELKNQQSVLEFQHNAEHCRIVA